MKNKFLTAVIVGVAVLATLYLFKGELSGVDTAGDAPAPETASEAVAEPPATVVAAQAAACVLKGELKYEGKKIEVNDCMRNDGLAPDVFQATCEWVADYGSAYGERPTVTYVDSCPAAHQGACDTFFERPITVFYYRTNPEELASMKSSCDMQKGHWTAGGATPAEAAGKDDESRPGSDEERLKKVAKAPGETPQPATAQAPTEATASTDAEAPTENPSVKSPAPVTP